MTKLKQIYKCEICGNIVEVVHTGDGQLVCCGEPMKLQEETFEDEGHEKHLPVIEKVDNGTKIKIGSNPHPMIKEHYIEWIELINGDEYYRKFLSPEDKPEVVFEVEKEADIEARAYCNVHGLWALRN